MKNIAVLGSTGSIGESTLAVVAEHPERFCVKALAAGGNRIERLAEQARQFQVSFLAVPDAAQADAVRRLVDERVEVCWGTEGLVRAASVPEVELVVSAIVGAAGLIPTYAAVIEGRDVALANKETLVVAGELVIEAARKAGVRLLPVDSEHSAVAQALAGHRVEDVRRLVLTASGGPFRGAARGSLTLVTPDQALAHPNWSMGPKISVDSATLMNKGLEVIEAHWLFGLPPEQIEVTLHPQSVIHSLVEFVDGSLLAQLGVPDMRGPIAYALGYPERLPMGGLALDLWSMGPLTFEPPDRAAFPALDLAYQALRAGVTAPAVLSGANEVAVEAFLGRRIAFLQIAQVVEATLEAHPVERLDSIQTALKADLWARRTARAWVQAHGEGSN